MSSSLSSPIPSMLAHEQYFGFEQRPFELSPDPKFLYRSASHDAATEQLKQALRRKEGFLVLTGDIGTGKTTLCRALLGQMGPASFTSLILNPFLSVDELLREVLLDFGVVSRDAAHNGRFDAATTHDMMSTLYEFLQSIATIGGTAILIIDEAQHLTKLVLEQIRVLSNLEANDTKLLQIVLVGQLNLLDTLSHADMRQFAQRISLRARLSPLTRDEAEAYIQHRIMVAAPKRPVGFSPDGLGCVHTVAEGIPRVINLLCDRALAFAALDGETTVTVAHVRQAAAALELKLPPSLSMFRSSGDAGRSRKGTLIAAAVVALVAAAVGLTLWLRPLPTWVAAPVQPGLPARPPARVLPGITQLDMPPIDLVMPRRIPIGDEDE